MDDLIVFLRARLDEDERMARAVEDRSAPFDGHWGHDDDTRLRTHNGWSLAYLPEGRPFVSGLLPHIARHDPARVLADVASKRAIVDWCEAAIQVTSADYYDNLGIEQVLRALAAPYVAHRDYREERKP